MKGLLEVPAIRERAMKFSVEDYHRFTEGEPTELLRGTIIEKTSRSPLHYATFQRLRRILEKQVPAGCDLRVEGPLTLHDSEPEPDVAIVRGSPENFVTSHPHTAELAVEVAVSSLEIDRVKALIYAEARVAEYWIVCPEEKRVEVYRRPSEQGYAERTDFAAPAVLESSALPGVRVELAALFC